MKIMGTGERFKNLLKTDENTENGKSWKLLKDEGKCRTMMHMMKNSQQAPQIKNHDE